MADKMNEPTEDFDDDPLGKLGIKSVNGVPVSTVEDANEKEMAEEQRRILFPY